MALFVTLENARTLLTYGLIDISPIYMGGRKKPWWQFFKPRRRMWKVKQPLSIVLSTGKQIEIPVDFETDLRSAPRWLWSVVSPVNDGLLGYLIHDYLYVHNIGTREDADLEMFLWTQQIYDGELENLICYNIVRIPFFGGAWWNRAAKRLAATFDIQFS